MYPFKIKFHTCKIILLTSLVWFLIDVVVISFYSDCVSGSGWGCSENNLNHANQQALQKLTENSNKESTKGRGILYEQLRDRGKEENVSKRYSELRRWKPAPVVQEQLGLPGELGKAVVLPPEKEALMKEKFKLNQFNLLASDMISLNRSLTDVRLPRQVHSYISKTKYCFWS